MALLGFRVVMTDMEVVGQSPSPPELKSHTEQDIEVLEGGDSSCLCCFCCVSVSFLLF